MHRCSDSLGCLNVSVCRLGESLLVKAFRIGRDSPSERLSAFAKRIGCGLIASAGLVCTSKDYSYLYVIPDYVWLTPDTIAGEFDIYSNVSWVINLPPIDDDVITMVYNGMMITNSTMIKDADAVVYKSLSNGISLSNKYYLING